MPPLGPMNLVSLFTSNSFLPSSVITVMTFFLASTFTILPFTSLSAAKPLPASTSRTTTEPAIACRTMVGSHLEKKQGFHPARRRMNEKNKWPGQGGRRWTRACRIPATEARKLVGGLLRGRQQVADLAQDVVGQFAFQEFQHLGNEFLDLFGRHAELTELGNDGADALAAAEELADR